MGKGDKRTKKGKINRGSYGNSRRPGGRTTRRPAEAVKPAQGQPQAAKGE